MKAKFLQDTEIEIVEKLDNDGEPIFNAEFFKAGEIVEFDIESYAQKFNGAEFVDDKGIWNVQLGDGSMGMGVNKEWFEIINN